MLTRKRFVVPRYSGDAETDFRALNKAINDYLLSLETEGALVDDYQTNSSTPTVTSGTGTITTASASLTYTKNGRLIAFRCTVTVTTNGTGATDVRFTLPFTAAVRTAIYGYGISSGIGMAGYVSGSTAVFVAADGTYPVADGHIVEIAGHFEI